MDPRARKAPDTRHRLLGMCDLALARTSAGCGAVAAAKRNLKTQSKPASSDAAEVAQPHHSQPSQSAWKLVLHDRRRRALQRLEAAQRCSGQKRPPLAVGWRLPKMRWRPPTAQPRRRRAVPPTCNRSWWAAVCALWPWLPALKCEGVVQGTRHSVCCMSQETSAGQISRTAHKPGSCGSRLLVRCSRTFGGTVSVNDFGSKQGEHKQQATQAALLYRRRMRLDCWIEPFDEIVLEAQR
jgi:hypothetical protein